MRNPAAKVVAPPIFLFGLTAVCLLSWMTFNSLFFKQIPADDLMQVNGEFVDADSPDPFAPPSARQFGQENAALAFVLPARATSTESLLPILASAIFRLQLVRNSPSHGPPPTASSV